MFCELFPCVSVVLERFIYFGTVVTHKNFRLRISKFEECLLPFSSESCVFLSPIKNMEIKIQKTLLPAILYECETWSVILRKATQIEGI